MSRIRSTAPRRARSSRRWRGLSAANCCRRPRPRGCCRSWAIPRPAPTGSKAGSGRVDAEPQDRHRPGLGPVQAGYNDIGILTAPDGQLFCGGDDQEDLDPAADPHDADEQCRARRHPPARMTYGARIRRPITRQRASVQRQRPARGRQPRLELFIIRGFLSMRCAKRSTIDRRTPPAGLPTISAPPLSAPRDLRPKPGRSGRRPYRRRFSTCSGCRRTGGRLQQRYAPGQEFKPHIAGSSRAGHGRLQHQFARSPAAHLDGQPYCDQPEIAARPFKLSTRRPARGTGKFPVEQSAPQRLAQSAHASSGHEGPPRHRIRPLTDMPAS